MTITGVETKACHRDGFTVVELAIVVAGLAVLATIAWLINTSMRDRASDQAAVTSITRVATAFETHYSLSKPDPIRETHLETLGVRAHQVGVTASAGGVRWTNGESGGGDEISWQPGEPGEVGFALLSGSGKCVSITVKSWRTAGEASVDAPGDNGCVATSSHTQTNNPDPDGPDPDNPDSGDPDPDNPDPDDSDDPDGPDPDPENPEDPGPEPVRPVSPAGGDTPPFMWAEGPVASGGNMELSGHVSITGGAAHINGDLEASGSITASGVSVSGTVTCSGTDTCGHGPSSAQQLGAISNNPVDVHVPYAADIWRHYSPGAQIGGLNYNPALGAGGDWFDLCPDGTARAPDGPSPCTGTVVGEGAAIGDWVGFEGWFWEPHTLTWVSRHGAGMGNIPFGPAPAWQNPSRHRTEAVYYIHEASARLEGSGGGTITVVVEGNGDGRTGNLTITGSGPVYSPKLDDLLFLADGDIDMASSAPYQGWTGAGERLRAGGYSTYTGTIVAEGRANRDGSLLGPGPAITFNASVYLHFTIVYP